MPITHTSQADPELLYPGELLCPEQFSHKRSNLVVAPCRSGKSTAHEKFQMFPYGWIEQSDSLDYAKNFASSMAHRVW